MVTIARIVHEHDELPAGYAVAWWRLYTRDAVCLPVGLAQLAGAGRAAWIWLKTYFVRDSLVRAFERGYKEGRSAGLEQGRYELAAAVARAKVDGAAEALAEVEKIVERVYGR